MRTLRLFLFLTLTSCSHVDIHQAEVCEGVAKLLFAEGSIAGLSSATDASAAHAIVTTVRMRDSGLRHRVGCSFESSGPKSADFLALTTVASDVEGSLDYSRLAELRTALEAKGISWRVSWIPLLGPPHGSIGPAALDLSILYFLQLLINGLTYGSVIALVAVGYTLIAGISGIINLAFGDVYMIGAFVAVGLVGVATALGSGSFPLSVLIALVPTMAITSGYSALTHRAAFRPLRKANAQVPLIASIGLSMVLQGYVFTTGGAHDLWLTAPLPDGFVVAETEGFSLYVNWPQLAIVGTTLAFALLLWFVLMRTPFGRTHRACAQDRRMAALLGIDVDRIIGLTFGFAGAFAAVGGLIAAAYYGSVSVVMGVMMGLKGLTAAIVGGIGNPRGALLGGFIVALIESFAAGYFFAAYKEVAVFALLILLLIFRPEGLFGEP